MRFTEKKLRRAVEALRQAVVRDRMILSPWKFLEGDPADALTANSSGWKDIAVGARWGGPDRLAWFRTTADLPESFRSKRLALHLRFGDPAEALLYVNGNPLQGIDGPHPEAILPADLTASESLDLAVKVWTGYPGREQPFQQAELALPDADTESLHYNVRAALDTAELLPKESLTRVKILALLDAVYGMIDARKPGSEMFYASLAEGNRFFEERWPEIARSEEARPVVAAVGHAHIDVEWLWQLAHTREKSARTWATATHLMSQYPEYKFIQSQAQLYRFLKDDYPRLYERIKEYIRKGQWEVEGSLWVECDCNLTGGESMVRQVMFGTRFFREEFGVETQAVWLPDTFGYSWAMPQIILKSGLKYFLTSKISWNQYNPMPYDTFRWRGLDGSEVMTYFLTVPDEGGWASSWFATYNGNVNAKVVKGTWDKYQQKEISDEALLTYGYGDGGGGPTREMIEYARRLADAPGIPCLETRFAGEFLSHLEAKAEGHPRMPVWNGELYLEYHRGTYTSQAQVKRANRLSEILFHNAEAFASWCLAGLGCPYPQEKLNSGWEMILLNQFHDILPGSSIHAVYEDTARIYDAISEIGEDVLGTALRRLAEEVATPGEGAVVFNSASFDRGGLVSLPLPAGCHAADIEGNPLPQQAAGDELLVSMPEVPSMGYRTVLLQPGDAPEQPSSLTIEPDLLENDFFRLTLNPSGQIASCFDKRSGRDVLAPGARGNILQVFEDRPMGNDAWDIDIYYQDKMWEVDHLLSAEVLERGPERGVLKLTWQYLDSTIRQQITLYRAIPRIDFITDVDWHEHHLLLKAAFPVDIHATKATYDIQFGNVERPNHWNTSWDWARFETCAHKWADLSEGDYGVSLLNDCKYGHDIRDNVIRLTLIKCATSPDPEADQGAHRFTYSLYPHSDGWYAGGTVREAYALNYPLLSVRKSAPHGGQLPPSAAFARIDAPNVMIETIKKAEDSDDLVIRVYEYANRRGPACLSLYRPIASAAECNLMEADDRPTEVKDGKLYFSIAPYEIKTFKVRL
ncbi:MAG: alpha-mannosidase [Armatimonadetes bacterium]|nr:alpha-mannosidase [Armatimonadota bacterium]